MKFHLAFHMDIVNDIMDGKPASDNPETALQKIFSILAVLPSVRPGLADADSLTMSGDGTAVVSHASPFGRHLPSCPYRSGCARHYSDPDAEWGLVSSNKMPMGNDTVKDAHKYRCPLKCKRVDACPYEKECSL